MKIFRPQRIRKSETAAIRLSTGVSGEKYGCQQHPKSALEPSPTDSRSCWGCVDQCVLQSCGKPRGYEQFGFKILRTGEDQAEWTFERLKSLKYLQHVVNEAFRPKPAIGTNTGMVLRDTSLPTIGGPIASKSSPIFARKDDTVTISFYTSHRRQDLFRGNATVATRTLGQLCQNLAPKTSQSPRIPKHLISYCIYYLSQKHPG